jgi:hypothetical protein
MKGRHKTGTRCARLLTTTLLSAAACATVTALPAVAQTQTPPQAGMTVYIDPATGLIRSTPAPGTVPLQISPETANAASTSHEGLTPEPSAGPGGGVKMNLQGRFRSPLIATVDGQGRTRIQHLTPPSQSNPAQ